VESWREPHIHMRHGPYWNLDAQLMRSLSHL